ncbi:Zinc finger, AN1-type [Dillenia turbinata]|uniref:Zinc finger, AN1-type n=1 Tax=Dillenia turbinata TaxID=194707 RepID=A0AAN8V8W3_9MAGN
MEHDETGCQPPPEGPILCINNCGFFGSAATMDMCSKCHKDMLKQEQEKLAVSSIENLVNGSSSGTEKEPIVAGSADVYVDLVMPEDASAEPSQAFTFGQTNSTEKKEAPFQAFTFGQTSSTEKKEAPKRCNTCKKRLGLMGFNCRCGNLFCTAHRYSDKHDCPYDYRAAAQDAIAKANPVVKAEKLDKI